MERLIWLEEKNGRSRMAVLEDGIPVELVVTAPGGEPTVGNLYMGRVINVVPGMQAAFIDIGDEKNAFLPLAEAVPAGRALRPGDEVLVQVQKNSAGEKGARLTMHWSFPGKYAVLMPTTDSVGVSRHIVDEEARAALMGAADEGGGVVIRTAAQGAPIEDIRAEIQSLRAAWDALFEKAHAQKAPACVYSAGSLLDRALRDLNAPVTLGDIPPEIEAKLSRALRRKVWLDSGAYLVIDPCEAMTVIDVNSGKYTGKKKLSETLLRVNLEAAKEAARQVRLRDVGGIVVIDFADMDTDGEREAVLAAFLEALAPDRAKRHVHGFTGAGLLEMTRRSLYGPVRNTRTCPRCHGEGVIQEPWPQGGER